jgi:hypothetical protein
MRSAGRKFPSSWLPCRAALTILPYLGATAEIQNTAIFGQAQIAQAIQAILDQG